MFGSCDRLQRRVSASHVAVIFLITIDTVFISLWTKVHRIRVPCNRSAGSALFPKLVGCIIATNAPPENLFRKFSERGRKTHEYPRSEIRYHSDLSVISSE